MEAGYCLLNGEACRATRLVADDKLPVVDEARDWEMGARGNLLQSIEALEVA